MKLRHIDNGNDFDFGRTAEDYVRYRDIYPLSMYKKLVSLGIGCEGQRILDLGSGPAVLPRSMWQTGASFVAADISAEQLHYGRLAAEEQGARNITYKVCHAENTGFPDDSFDAVTAVQCFPYFDSKRACAEIYRVLKPGGLFCTVIMDWLSEEDAVLSQMIETVKQFNPNWQESGFADDDEPRPSWAAGQFAVRDVCTYPVTLSFTKEAWIGRVKTCRGIGGSLSAERVEAFARCYRDLLQPYDEPLLLKHQIRIAVYRSTKAATKNK